MSESIKQILKPYSNIIWDWNGTLLNDLHLNQQINAAMMSDRGMVPACIKTHRKHFTFPVTNYLSFLGFDLSEPDSYRHIAVDFHKRYKEREHEAELFEGTTEMLSDLNEEGKNLSVLSLAEQNHLEEILKRFEIRDQFKTVYGAHTIESHGKMERGLTLMQECGYSPGETILIGDTLHDAEVAEAMGADVLLIGDGHQCPSRFGEIKGHVLHSRFA